MNINGISSASGTQNWASNAASGGRQGLDLNSLASKFQIGPANGLDGQGRGGCQSCGQ